MTDATRSFDEFLILNNQALWKLEHLSAQMYDKNPTIVASVRDLEKTVNVIVDLYLSYHEEDEQLRKINQGLFSTGRYAASDMDMRLRLGYANMVDEPRKALQKSLFDMEEITGLGQVKSIEQVIRYIHRNFLKDAYTRGFETSGHEEKSTYILKRPGIEGEVLIIDQANTIKKHNNTITSKHPVIKGALKYYEQCSETNILPHIVTHPEHTVIDVQFPKNVHSITMSTTNDNVSVFITGKPENGRRREEFFDEYFKQQGYEETRSSDTGTIFSKRIDDRTDLQQEVRFFLYMAENSPDMDVQGMRVKGAYFFEYMKNLLLLKDFEEFKRHGGVMWDDRHFDYSYFDYEKQVDEATLQQKKALLISTYSPFPTVSSKAARNPGKTHIDDFVNPDPLGFAYYHLTSFFKERVNAKELTSLVKDVDHIHNMCFSQGDVRWEKETYNTFEQDLRTEYGEQSIGLTEAKAFLQHYRFDKKRENPRWEKPGFLKQ